VGQARVPRQRNGDRSPVGEVDAACPCRPQRRAPEGMSLQPAKKPYQASRIVA
jgi:hypothetical protein